VRLSEFGRANTADRVWEAGSFRVVGKGGDMSADDLRVGDCYDLKDPTADTVDNVTARPCTEAHEYEMFFIGTIPGSDYPSEDTVTMSVETSCAPAFGAYVGKAYADSVLEIAWLYPASDAWAGGDHSIQCSAYNPDNSRLTASLKGSGQ